MADEIVKKYKINRVTGSKSDGSAILEVVHPETEAGQVLYTGKIGTTDVANVDQALGALKTLAEKSGVTSVNGQTGPVTVTPANIGAVASNNPITALTKQTVVKLAYDSKGLVTGSTGATLDDIPDGTSRKIPTDYIPNSQKGANNGVATLDDKGKVPSTQLPSYVDDVLERYVVSGADVFSSGWLTEKSGTSATTPETGKIYVVLSSGEYINKTYRWSGSSYVEISSSLVIGTEAGNAFDGKRGYDAEQDIVALEGDVAEIKNGGITVGKAADADKLGGADAEDYAKLTDIADLDGLHLVTGTIHSFSSWVETGLNISENYSTIHTAISNGKVPVLKITASDNGDYAYFYFSYGELAEYDDEQDTIEFYCMYGRSKLLYITMDADGNIYANSRTLYNGVTDGAEATNLPIVSRIYDQNGGIKVTRRKMTSDDLPEPTFDTSHALYSAVRVNPKGIITAGGNSIEWGTSSNNAPSNALMVNGLFFELVE